MCVKWPSHSRNIALHACLRVGADRLAIREHNFGCRYEGKENLNVETIGKLQTWYKAQCNGLWEHHHGVKIGTLDNPGWTVTIDLDETEKASEPFQEIKLESSETNWLRCWKQGNKFRGVGDPDKLDIILQHFIQFIEH